jgi:hypothetical protein
LIEPLLATQLNLLASSAKELSQKMSSLECFEFNLSKEAALTDFLVYGFCPSAVAEPRNAPERK